jgi:hypothetical protein
MGQLKTGGMWFAGGLQLGKKREKGKNVQHISCTLVKVPAMID